MAKKSTETAAEKREKRQEAKEQEQLKMLMAYDEVLTELKRVQEQLEAKATYDDETETYTAKDPKDQPYVDRLADKENELNRSEETISNSWTRKYFPSTIDPAIGGPYKKYKSQGIVDSYAEVGGYETPEAVPTSSERAAFAESVEAGHRERTNIEVIQNLKEAGLSPSDLLVSGPKQEQAIRIALPRTEAETLLALLASNPAEAQKKLQALHDSLDKTFKTVESLNVDLNQFEEDRVTQTISEGVKTVLTNAKENPIPATIALLALAGAAYGLWNHVLGDKGKKWVMGIGGAAGLAWAVNYGSSLFTKDGRTLMQRYLYDPDKENFNGVTNELKKHIETLTNENETAFQALMFLKDARASTFVDAFEGSLVADPENRTIDPSVFLGDIPASEARKINARGLYEGVEALMILTAKKAGRSGNDDLLAKEGVKIFRQKYASGGRDIKFQYIVADLMGFDAPAHTNPDGSSAEGAGLGRGVRNPESNGLERAFEGFGQEVDIRHKEGDIYLFNDYPLTVKIETTGGRTTYIIEDPSDASAHWELVKEAGDKDLYAKAIIDHVENRVNTGFKEQYKPAADVKVAYNKERNRWEVMKEDGTGGLKEFTYGTAVDDILKASFKPRLYVVPGVDGYMQLRMELVEAGTVVPDEGNYPSIDKALEKTVEKAVHSKIKKDMAFVMGDLTFEITSALNPPPTDADGSRVEIEYHGFVGKVWYKNGAVVKYELDKNCPELRKEWETLAKREAYQFIGAVAVQNNLESLRAAYEGQQHAGGFTSLDGIQAYATQIWERVTGDSRASYRSQEAEWFETIQLQVMEIESMVKYDFIALYRTNPSFNDVLAHRDTTGSGTLAKAAEKIKDLDDLAKQIANRPGTDAGTIDARRQAEMDALRESNYKNEPFKSLMRFVDNELTKEKGWDAQGDEDLARARAIKNYIKWKIFDLAYPIPNLTTINADHQKWIDNVQYQFQNVLGKAQLNPASAGFFGFDRRYNEVTFDRALAEAGVKQFQEEYPDSSAPVVAGVVITHRAPGPGGVPGGPSSGVSRYPALNEARTDYEKIDAGRVALEEIYKPVDELEWSVTDDAFDAYIGYRRFLLVDRMQKLPATLPTGSTLEAEIAKILDEAQKEVTLFIKYKTREDHDDEVVLIQAMGDLTKLTVGDTTPFGVGSESPWSKPSIEVMQWLMGNFEFENWAFIDNPEIFNDLMDNYYSKIGFGAKSVVQNGVSQTITNPKFTQEYAQYWMYTASKLLPGDRNWDANYFNTKERQVNTAELKANMNKLDKILSLQEWVDAGGPKYQVLLENNLTYGVAEGVERDKEKMRAEFADWFDDNMDLSQWTRFDGNWPSIFKQHAMERLLIEIDPKCTTSEELATEIQEYKKYLRIEKQFYDYIIEGKVQDDDRNYYSLFDVTAAGLGLYLGGPLPAIGAGLGVGLLGNFFKEYYVLPSLGVNAGSTWHKKVQEIINEEFKNNFLASPRKTPRDYAQGLSTQLGELIKDAEISDARSYDLVGPFAFGGFEGVDSFQVTP